MTKRWFGRALFNFFVAACLGALMRYAFVKEIAWMDYRNIMHAHSHVAMLGWMHLAFYVLLIDKFVKTGISRPFYNRIFWLTQICVIGMLLSFPFEGYGPFSIFFSTAHVFLSYIFFYRFNKNVNEGQNRFSPSLLFVKTSLWLMVLGTLGLFLMPILMVKGLSNSPIYYGAVQFFLHFQLNGFYIFAALALFFKLLEDRQIFFSSKRIHLFYRLLLVSTLLTYVLAVTWSTPLPFLFLLNSLGVFIQFLAWLCFLILIRSRIKAIEQIINGWTKVIFGLAFISFSLKIIVQTAVVIPHIATIAYTIHNFVIGFIHLILLATISSVILAQATKNKWINMKVSLSRVGLILLFCGIILSEGILFVQGLLFWYEKGFIPGYYPIIFIVSLLMPIGILLMLISRFSLNASTLKE